MKAEDEDLATAMPEPPRVLVVAFTTRMIANLEGKIPAFSAPRNYKDPAKIEEYIAEQRVHFLERAKSMPYVSTFDVVRIVDKSAKRIRDFTYAAHENENKPPVAVRVRNYLKVHYPTVWPSGMQPAKSDVILVGFEMRKFLKMLGLECAKLGRAAPFSLWNGNSYHRDIGNVILPDECKELTLKYALRELCPTDPEEATAWESWLEHWEGPCNDVVTDAKLVAALVERFAMGQVGDEGDETP